LIDKNLIQGKIDLIEKDLQFLKQYKSIQNEEFLNNYKDIQAVKYSLFEIIEASIDIASHIISIKGFERAESYAEMFEILGKKNIVDLKLSERLANMARFRNVLIHGYAKVDNSKILTYVQKNLIDLADFIKSILKFLKNENEN
jgi:uncharacterized protein YutE (UPF0331/DUF86 family)